MMRTLLPNAILILLAGLLLAACGGGSGGLDVGGGTGTPGAGGGGVAPPEPTITIRLVRADETGTEVDVTRIDPNQPATVVATFANTDDDAIVTFQTTIGQLDPAAGTVLSSNGEARIVIQAGQTAGAGEVQASATLEGGLITSNSVAFEVLEFEEVEEDLQLGICSGGTSPLDCTSAGTNFIPNVIETTLDTVVGEPADGIPAQGTAEISFVVVDASTTPVTPVGNVPVTITSRCSNLDLASISAAQSDGTGAVVATYQATGCEETDNITATIPSTGSTANGSIFVFPPRIGSIVFDRVVDSVGDSIQGIFIQESGGESTARVIFKVLDRFGDPKPDVDVRFELTTTIGGLALQNSLRKTDNAGEAVAFVNSGFIATTVRVRATIDVDTDNDGIDDQTLVTLSDQLSVNTGIADQNSMSLSVNQFSVEGEDLDGQQIEVTVRLSDLFNNPVRDGTTVQFRTEYGRIVPACNTLGGTCTVTWNSQEPRRPLDGNTFIGSGASCPKMLIVEEEVTISGTDGDTGFYVDTIRRVETTADVELNASEYTSDTDGSGITCDDAATVCIDGATLKITYERAWADEDPPVGGDTEHTISNPGLATPPFTPNGLPCLVGRRDATTDVPAYFGSAGQVYGGRTTIFAFAQGEESFIDTNGNGIYDEGEPFEDLPEAFLDTNEDGVFGNGTPGVDDSSDNTPEHWSCYGPANPLSPNNPPLNRCFQVGGDEDLLLDFNENGTFEEGNGIYNGTLCPLNPDGVTTPDYCTRELVNIRRDIVILAAGSFDEGGSALRAGTAFGGEWVVRVDIAPSVTTPGPGNFYADRNVVTNDGTTLFAGTIFTVGYEDLQVTPGIGETANLATGNGGVSFFFADKFQGSLPSTSTISIDGSGVCQFELTPTQVFDSNAFGPSFINIGVRPVDNPPSPSVATSIVINTPNNRVSGGFIECKVE